MSTYLTRAQRKLAIASHRRVRELLEGEYGSIFKGRGLDFEDLRTYVPGDNVKDIDWRATARTGTPLIKQYVATRKHNVMLVVDTSREMACASTSGAPKKDIGLLLCGALAYIAQKHGDNVSLLAGDGENTKLFASTTKLAQIELMLRYADEQTTEDSAGQSLERLLAYMQKRVVKRSLVVIISDKVARSDEMRQTFRRMAMRHEVMFVGISDQRPDDKSLLAEALGDISTSDPVLAEIRQRPDVAQEFTAWLADEREQNEAWLTRAGVPAVEVGDEDSVVPELFRLLERQKQRGRRI
jgi:uncharacterized protein (DUF58 family)